MSDFSKNLYDKMSKIVKALKYVELYEFQYALKNMRPESGNWEDVKLIEKDEIEKMITSVKFFEDIKLKPRKDGKIVLDEAVESLSKVLFAGIESGKYDTSWVDDKFYFDVRGFVFIPRTKYFTDDVIKHLNGGPYKTYEKKQSVFEEYQGVGYKDFKTANAVVDKELAETIKKLIDKRGTPVLIGIAGPTAAGKTEFTEYLTTLFKSEGKSVTSIEMDNFFLDRDYREEIGVGSMGKKSIHFKILVKVLKEIVEGNSIQIPRYDFVKATSSHDNDGNLRDGEEPITIEPADVIYIEGNFPFLFEEVLPLIGVKLIYLTDDPVRLKRKWKRDVDYRKKYDPNYLVNRYFRTQFLKAQECYIPQLNTCDFVLNTTGAEIWTTKEVAEELK